jgi:prephenate dehydrogenase
MSGQITIIGLGQIGTSLGSALGKSSDTLQRAGYDIKPSAARQAKQLGALDKAEVNLPAAVRGADIVLLAIPADQVSETMKTIIPELKLGTVILDTCPIRREINTQLHASLPKGRYYIGFTPMFGPDHIDKVESGIEAADPDLFQRGLFAITAPRDTAKEALQVAVDLCHALGASPLFADELEVDSLMAAVHILPQLMAAALVNSTMERPGWQEGRKFAGRAYSLASSTIGHQDTPEALASLSIWNQENVLRVLDGLLHEVQKIRGHIDQKTMPELVKELQSAQKSQRQWQGERQAADWAGEQQPRLDNLKAGSNWLGGSFKEKKQEPGE